MKPSFRSLAFLSPNRKRHARASSLSCVLSLSALTLQVTNHAQAAVLYWDASNGNGTVADGNGNWATTGTKVDTWNTSVTGGPNTRSAWANGGDANFYTSGKSLVTITGAVNVNSITFTGTGYTVGGTALTLTGAGGNITATSAGIINAPIAGSVGLTKLGAATLTLGGANTYSGGTTVSVGTLLLSGSGTLGDAAGAVAVSGGTLDLGGLTRSRTGTVSLTGGAINNGNLDKTGGTFDAQSGSASAILGGTAGLAKTTSGTVTLSGANSYTGATSVTDGTLIVSGSLASGSAVAVSSSGKLTGSGTIGGATTMSGTGKYSAGTFGTAGSQTLTGGINFASGGIFSWDLSALTSDTGMTNQGSYDKVTGTGTGTAGTFEVVLGSNAFTDVFWNTAKTWTDIFSGSDPTFTLFSGAGVSSDGTVTGQGQFTYTTGTLNWTAFSAVPEPTGALAGILLGAGLLRRKRR